MACANQELGNQSNVDDPITVPISGRDFSQLAAECEDIAVEIFEFYKQTYPDGLTAMMAIPPNLVLLEDRYDYMKRKKNRFEKMLAKMLAFQPEPPPFQNAPPQSFQVQNAPPPAFQNAPPPSFQVQNAPPRPYEHYTAVNNCLDVIRKLPDRFAWVEFAKTDDIQHSRGLPCRAFARTTWPGP